VSSIQEYRYLFENFFYCLEAEKARILVYFQHKVTGLSTKVPGKDDIETCIRTLNLDTIQWKKIKEFLRSKIQSERLRRMKLAGILPKKK